MSLNDFLEKNPQFKGMRRNLEMEEIQVKRFEKIIQELRSKGQKSILHINPGHLTYSVKCLQSV